MRNFVRNRLVMACVMALVGASLNPIRADVFNGVDWGNNVYDPAAGTPAGKDGLPTDGTKTSPAWVSVSNGAPNSIELTGDALRITTGDALTPKAGTRSFNQLNNLNSTTLTFEMRLRVVEQRGDTYAQTILLGGASTFTEVAFGAEKVLLQGSSGWYVTSMAQFRTLRVTVEPLADGKQRFRVYLDGNTTPVQTVTKAATYAITYLRIGDSSTSVATNGVVDYDYVRWTTAGAFIPEPATLSLLGLAAIGLLRRTR